MLNYFVVRSWIVVPWHLDEKSGLLLSLYYFCVIFLMKTLIVCGSNVYAGQLGAFVVGKVNGALMQ
jgi:hypothetical protein